MSELILNITEHDITLAKRMRSDATHDPKLACPIALAATRQLGRQCFTTPYKLHVGTLTRRLPVRGMDFMDRFDSHEFVRAQRIDFP